MMKNFTKSTILVAVLVLIAFASNAQVSFTGELRPRFEYRHGYKSLADLNMDAASFISQRTRLNLGYINDKFQTKLAVQDVRVWGNQPQQNITDGSISLHEAWAEYSFSKKFSAKFGRQEIAYDDERIMSGGNWNQQARSHDALVLKYVDNSLTMHAGFAFNQNQEQLNTTRYTLKGSYKDMQYFWLNKKWSHLDFSYLFLNVGQQAPSEVKNSTRHSFTTGTNIIYKYEKLTAVGKGYYTGGVDATTRKSMNAFLAGGEFTYAPAPKYSAGLGYEFQSGQSQTNTTQGYTNENHAFFPVFGGNHAFNGLMDYFYVGNHTNSVGLQDLYLKLKYKAEKWSTGLDVHRFNSAADILDKNHFAATGDYKAVNSYLGTELDLTVNYPVSPICTITGGYSQMFGTESMQVLKNGGNTGTTSNWGYLMITLKPNFLK